VRCSGEVPCTACTKTIEPHTCVFDGIVSRLKHLKTSNKEDNSHTEPEEAALSFPFDQEEWVAEPSVSEMLVPIDFGHSLEIMCGISDSVNAGFGNNSASYGPAMQIWNDQLFAYCNTFSGISNGEEGRFVCH
jgi:hypothetical protein